MLDHAGVFPRLRMSQLWIPKFRVEKSTRGADALILYFTEFELSFILKDFKLLNSQLLYSQPRHSTTFLKIEGRRTAKWRQKAGWKKPFKKKPLEGVFQKDSQSFSLLSSSFFNVTNFIRLHQVFSALSIKIKQDFYRLLVGLRIWLGCITRHFQAIQHVAQGMEYHEHCEIERSALVVFAWRRFYVKAATKNISPFIGKILDKSLTIFKNRDLNIEIYVHPPKSGSESKKRFKEFDTSFCKEDLNGTMNCKWYVEYWNTWTAFYFISNVHWLHRMLWIWKSWSYFER